jgi:hypothetical protein
MLCLEERTFGESIYEKSNIAVRNTVVTKFCFKFNLRFCESGEVCEFKGLVEQISQNGSNHDLVVHVQGNLCQ